MKKIILLLVAVSVSCVIFSRPAIAGEKPPATVSAQPLNSVPLLGPEGILLAPDGNIYAGEHDGKIDRVMADGTVEVFANLNNLPGEHKPIGAVGIAMDGDGDIYAATLDFNGGSVLKVVGPGKPDAGKVSLFRNGIGMANFILIDKETSTMYVSDSSMFSGRVFRFDMKDEARIGKPADAEKELLGKFAYANGLALGPDKEWLYVAETTNGRISKVNLKTKQSQVFVKLGGWTDGITYDPERQLIFACDNRGGRISAVDMSGKVVGEVHVMGKEGQCAPASLIFRDPNTVVFTDLWKASLWRALIGKPQYHSYVYQLPVSDIVKP